MVAVLTAVNKVIYTLNTNPVNMSRIDSDSNVATLHRLGLTVLEAKVYATLALTGSSDVKTMARYIDVAKCEVYRALATLEKSGLVEKVLATPAIYKPIPIREASRILLEKRSSEYNELERESQELITILDRAESSGLQAESETGIVVTGGKIVLRKLLNQLRTAKSSFETISTWNICAKMLCYCLNDLTKLTDKQVHIRVLTDFNANCELTPSFLSELQKSPFFEIRYYGKELTLKMAIRDRSEVNVCFSEKEDTPNIWSINPIFAQLANKTFECMWNEAAQGKKRRSKNCTVLPA